MNKRGLLFRTFLDSDAWQRQDIENTTDTASEALAATYDLENRMATLRGQVVKLATVLDILLDKLQAHGLVDEDELRQLAEAALHPAPARPAPASGSPYRDAAPTPASVPMETCAACCQRVPQRNTNITDRGVVCDRCFAG